jgi:hypothetical protein
VGEPNRAYLGAPGRRGVTGAAVKKIDVSAHIGDSGIALIHQMVNKMGFAWHERKLDAGIDGEIELRNPVTGEVANRLILVQSKARDRPFPGENDPEAGPLVQARLAVFSGKTPDWMVQIPASSVEAISASSSAWPTPRPWLAGST